MKKGLLQKEVAKIIGVTEDCITYWENGRSKPMKKYQLRIESFLLSK
ncbi:MAG: helix-turn-helix transcriptional regulator [Bacteroidetes bacterium]|nr:helix-turn-helix transcriptional regulator [Bacteroidota bacterium]